MTTTSGSFSHQWYSNGKCTRLIGPAVIFGNKKVVSYTYLVDNQSYNKFNCDRILRLQIFIKMLKVNCMIYSPDNLGGKITKNLLYKMITNEI